MDKEIIKEIAVNEKNELLLIVIGDGKPMYQYVYREGAGVNWDENQKAFKSTPLREWTVSEWFKHIRDIVKSVVRIELLLAENVIWKNISDTEITKIKNYLQHIRSPNTMRNRNSAAELATLFMNNTIDYSKFMIEYPEDDDDKELNELFDLIEHMPAVGGLFGETKKEHTSRVVRINQLISIFQSN